MSTISYEPLFLKYRPQVLDDIVGQISVKETLRHAIADQKLVHAYLLTGPRGAGKTSTARILAKCLNCEDPLDGQSPTTKPCGTCPSCVSIAHSNSIDVVEIDAASHGGVEDARSLIEKVHLASVSGKYKAYIIDEVHMLSNAAFNALLKVFEEPPENVVFILATTEEDKVLPTIKSRCQVLKFKPISVNDCVSRMQHIASEENINISEEAMKIIAKQADGAMRDALSMLDQVSVFADANQEVDPKLVIEMLGGVAREDVLALIESLLAKDVSQMLTKLDDIYAHGKDPLAIAKYLQDLLLEQLEGSEEALSNIITQENIESFELVQIVDALAELEFRLKASAQSKNLLRACLVKLAHRVDFLIVRELKAKLDALELGRSLPASSSLPRPQAAIPVSSPDPVRPALSPAANDVPPPRAPEPVNDVPAPRASIPAPSPAPAAPTTPSPVSSGSVDQSFVDFLPPASKGLYVSSKAVLHEVQADKAIIYMPVKYKFLKGKIEAKSADFISAITNSGSPVTQLEVELVDSDIVEGRSPDFNPKQQAADTNQPAAVATGEICCDRGAREDAPPSPDFDQPVFSEPPPGYGQAMSESEQAALGPSKRLDSSQQDDNAENESEEEQAKLPKFKRKIDTGSPKFDEILTMGVKTFGGKLV